MKKRSPSISSLVVVIEPIPLSFIIPDFRQTPLLGTGLLARRDLGLIRFVIPNRLRPLAHAVFLQLARQHQLRRGIEVPLPQRLLRTAGQQEVLLRLRCQSFHHVDAEVVHDPHGLLRDSDFRMGLLISHWGVNFAVRDIWIMGFNNICTRVSKGRVV